LVSHIILLSTSTQVDFRGDMAFKGEKIKKFLIDSLVFQKFFVKPSKIGNYDHKLRMSWYNL